LAIFIPSHVEPARVLAAPVERRLVGSVRRSRREVREERPLRSNGLLLVNPADAFVGEVASELIALLGPLRRLDWVRVADQRRVELIGLAADEAVEVVEALIGRPIIEGTSRTRLIVRNVVILAEPRARVAGLFQQLGERRTALRDDTAVTGVAG